MYKVTFTEGATVTVIDSHGDAPIITQTEVEEGQEFFTKRQPSKTELGDMRWDMGGSIVMMAPAESVKVEG